MPQKLPTTHAGRIALREENEERRDEERIELARNGHTFRTGAPYHPRRKVKNLPARTHPDEPDVKEDGEERLRWKIMEILPDTATYSAYDRFNTLVAWAQTGSLSKVHQILPNIPKTTVSHWKQAATWWKPALEMVKELLDEELDGRLTYIITKAVKKLEERLEHGDEVVTKDGEIINKEVAFRDVASGVQIVVDKRQLLRGSATQIVKTVSDSDKLKQLQERFKTIAKPGRVIDITPEKAD